MSRPLRIALTLLATAVLAALAVYAWRGHWARYVTDDFCTAAALRHYGFWGAMKFHRMSWSGRYAYYAIKAIPESIGAATASVMPGVMIALFTGAGIWTLRRLTRSNLLAILGGATLAFAAIDATPEVLAIGGPLVWETGTVTYMLPLILYTIWAGLFFSKRGHWIVSALLMLVAGGLSETSLAAQCAMTGALALIVVLRKLREYRALAIAAFVASLLALALVATAPGNVIRMRRLPPRQPLPVAMAKSVRLSYDYIGSVAFADGKSLLLVMLCGAVAGMLMRFKVTDALLAAVVALCGYGASFLPSTWMLSMGPPPRALHVTNFFFMAALFALCAALGSARPQLVERFAPALLVIAILVPVFAMQVVIDDVPRARRGAAELDRIGSIMRAHRGQRVTSHSPWASAERALVEEPEFWTNRCISEFYGALSLRITR
ncbi:MAG TPA: DUF6056 family protein [Thermoanaerobaculia bacterium]|nr:DUF6056 family protein [Thermoanaerobaculia bacterium]